MNFRSCNHGLWMLLQEEEVEQKLFQNWWNRILYHIEENAKMRIRMGEQIVT